MIKSYLTARPKSHRKFIIALVSVVLLGLIAFGISPKETNTVQAAPPAQGPVTPRVYLPLLLGASGSVPTATVTPSPTGTTTTIATATRTPTSVATATRTPTNVATATRTTTPSSATPPPSSNEWAMLAANPQRTSWTPEEVRGQLGVQWYRPIEPYISYKIQPIAANGNIYVSTARGLYAFRASDGAQLWVYATQLPLGHSPTIAKVNGNTIAYVGGYDRKIHAINASTGAAIGGYTPYLADAGFDTNPLVINDANVANTIFAGNRDGYFYALNAVTGALKWRFKTDGPILFSAAYKDGTLYFASNDSYAYALNASDGSLIWKSQKLLGAGFHSFWPVIYTEKQSGKDYVIFTGQENYRFMDQNGAIGTLWPDLARLDQQYLWGSCWPNSCSGGIIWPTGSETGTGTYWGHSVATLNVNAITNYYENVPAHRMVFVLNAANGKEYTFDSNGNGKAEYAPFTYSGITSSGNKYPPVINGVDDVYYQNTIFRRNNWISGGNAVGWKWGTNIVSQVKFDHAVDEPMAYSAGGKLIYWNVCCDRQAGAFDVTIPYGQQNRDWEYWGAGINGGAPDYGAMYNDGNSTLYNNINGWQVYSGKNQSKNGVYGKHGTAQSPPIPYQGKVYMLIGNALMALSPNPPGGSPTKLALANMIVDQSAPTPPTKAELKQRLESEVQKIIAAGPLRPGYFSSGFIDLYGHGHFDSNQEFGEIFDYFQNPSDTVYTLLLAYPQLSAGTQAQVKTYLQNNYGPGSTYDFTKIVHIGWGSGAARESFELPSEVWQIWGTPYESPLNPSTQPIIVNSNSQVYWKYFPPFSFYAAWKYAQIVGNNDPNTAKSIFNAMSSKIEAPPANANLIKKPYFINLYAAGYLGYLNLKQLAGLGDDATVRGYYNQMLSLRVNNFSKDTPYWNTDSNQLGLPGLDYNRSLSVARNFMFLTPEIADYMNQNIKSQVQGAVDEYSYVAPYWFVPKFEAEVGEGTMQQLYDPPALYQAKAWVLKQSYNELAKWLDVPAFSRGDLFYIQNVVAALGATP